MKRPILLIHGFSGGHYEFRPIIKFLKANGWEKFYEFSYGRKFGQVSLREISKELDSFIADNVKESEFDVVAISQGGIIARHQIARTHNNRVRKCVTLCAPHHGSWLAYLLFLPGVKDLRPKSPVLNDLDENKAEYHAVYNPLDLMVLPGWSAKMDSAKSNLCVFSPLHQLTFWNKKTLKFIAESFSN